MLVRIRSGVSRMRRFSTDAAHQLRTPLTALHTRLEVTLERERTLGEYQRVLAETLAEIQLLEAGVRSILQLAESATGHTPGQRQLVGLKPVLWSVADFFQPLAREAGIELHCELSQDLDVWGDPASLHHLFANLVDNAIKYSKPGASVTLGLEREPGFARVEVRDTGPGIQKEDRARIFEDFFRGGEPSSVGGIGLGLTLALEIARAHGGTIELEGNSSGSTFHVRLPTGSLPAG